MMKISATGHPEFVAQWKQIRDEAEAIDRAWFASLRKQGFKAAHPNDGWVDREKNTVYLAYAQFNDGLEIGDLLMLGWSFDRPEDLRPVRITGKEQKFMGGIRWSFEDLPKPKPSLRKRVMKALWWWI